VVTYRNGKSKGLAYVEFEDEQSASNALMQTDNMLIGEHQISVAISNPPKRAKDDSAGVSKQQLASSLGGGSINNRSTASSGSSAVSSQKSASSFSSFVPRSQMVRKKALNL
jgi:RNA recognition motif-containing protein